MNRWLLLAVFTCPYTERTEAEIEAEEWSDDPAENPEPGDSPCVHLGSKVFLVAPGPGARRTLAGAVETFIRTEPGIAGVVGRTGIDEDDRRFYVWGTLFDTPGEAEAAADGSEHGDRHVWGLTWPDVTWLDGLLAEL